MKAIPYMHTPPSTPTETAAASSGKWRYILMKLLLVASLISILGLYAAPDFMRNISNVLYSCF